MRGGEQNSRHVDSAVGAMRALVHILQIMQRKEMTKYPAKPVGTEPSSQPTFKERWLARCATTR